MKIPSMIFSFYSYKGGVGRSQLCANVAAYLCHKRNKRVLLLDWDFEAPGLHYYFGLKEEAVTVDGSLELLEQYMALMLTNEQVSQKDYPSFDKGSILNLLQAKGWKDQGVGCVDLIPAGCYEEAYIPRVNNFNWYQFYNRLDGQVYIEWLKGQLKGLGYDYILIDSRTGINDYSGICNLHLPDANIVVMAANSQNMRGCKNLIDQIINHPYTQHEEGYRTKYILPVLSRINVNNPNFEYWADEFVEHFQPLMEHWETELPRAFRKDIFRDFYLEKVLLEDMPQYSAGENILFKNRKQRLHRSSFAAKFAHLAQYLEDLREKKKIQLEEQIDRDAWEYYAQEAEYRLEKGELTRRDVAYAYEQAGDVENAERFGGTVDLYIQEYKDFYVKGKYREAGKILLKALALDEENVAIYLELSRVYKRLGELEAAEKILLKAVEIDADSIDAYKLLGSIYYKKNQFTKALDVFKNQVLDIDPMDKDALVYLAIIYEDTKQPELAIEAFELANKLYPNDYQILTNMGTLYGKREDFALAIEYFEKALALKPNNQTVLANIGVIYKKLGDMGAGIKIYEQLHELDPKNTKWLLHLARLYRQQDSWKFAKKHLDKALEINEEEVLTILTDNQQENPEDLDAYIELGRAYQQLRRWGKALNNYEKVLQLDPQNITASTLIGNVYSSKGSLHIALEYYLKSLVLNAQDDYVLYRLGNTYNRIGNYEAAIEAYQQCLALNPTNRNARNNLGVVYYKNGQPQLAVETYLQSLTIHKDHEVYHNNIGYLYLMTGAVAKALPYLERSLELGLVDFASRNLGHYYLVQKDTDRALKYYQQSWEAFEDGLEFWTGIEQDFQYLRENGVTLEEYEAVKNALLEWIDARGKNRDYRE
jgi:tetratricopeptide (TPR) repeat protein